MVPSAAPSQGSMLQGLGDIWLLLQACSYASESTAQALTMLERQIEIAHSGLIQVSTDGPDVTHSQNISHRIHLHRDAPALVLCDSYLSASIMCLYSQLSSTV